MTLNKYFVALLAVFVLSPMTASVASAGAAPEYLFAGDHPDLIPGDGALFHLRGKPGEGGRLSAYRINMHLDCPGSSYAVQLGDYVVVGTLPAVRNGKLRFTFDQEDPFIGTMRVNNEIRFCGLSGLVKCKKHGKKVKTFKKAFVQVTVATPHAAEGDRCTGIVDSFFVTRGS